MKHTYKLALLSLTIAMTTYENVSAAALIRATQEFLFGPQLMPALGAAHLREAEKKHTDLLAKDHQLRTLASNLVTSQKELSKGETTNYSRTLDSLSPEQFEKIDFSNTDATNPAANSESVQASFGFFAGQAKEELISVAAQRHIARQTFDQARQETPLSFAERAAFFTHRFVVPAVYCYGAYKLIENRLAESLSIVPAAGLSSILLYHYIATSSQTAGERPVTRLSTELKQRTLLIGVPFISMAAIVGGTMLYINYKG